MASPPPPPSSLCSSGLSVPLPSPPGLWHRVQLQREGWCWACKLLHDGFLRPQQRLSLPTTLLAGRSGRAVTVQGWQGQPDRLGMHPGPLGSTPQGLLSTAPPPTLQILCPCPKLEAAAISLLRGRVVKEGAHCLVRGPRTGRAGRARSMSVSPHTVGIQQVATCAFFPFALLPPSLLLLFLESSQVPGRLFHGSPP